MNNDELDHLLKSANEPGRPAEYWEAFPNSVVSGLAGQRRSPKAETSEKPFVLPSFRFVIGMGLAVACLILALALNRDFKQSGSDFTANDVAVMETYLHEIQRLFPNQLRAVIFEQSGPRLLLADRASVPSHLPVYLKICDEGGCRSFLTFSGQQIRLNGELIDVLVDGNGDVLLVGTKLSWTSGSSDPRVGSLRIMARTLETVS